MSEVKQGLEAEGFRYVCRDGLFNWVHPLEMLDSDVDCSDMSDAEFDSFVRQVREE